MKAGRDTFSIALRTDLLLAAIEKQFKSPEKKAETYQKMKARASDEDRAKRIKSRFNAFKAELDTIHGKTTGEDGKIRKDIQKAKRAAMLDRLLSDLAPASPDLRRLVLESVTAPEDVKKLISKELKTSPKKP